MRIFGIEFAPLIIPWRRRMQTLAVLYWTLTFLFEGFGCLFLMVFICFTKYYYISLIYLVWYIYDYNKSSQGGRRSEWARRWPIWTYLRDYFPIELVKTTALDPKRNYLFCFHPHGVMSAGAFVNFSTEATGFSKKFPGLTPYLLVLRGQFQFPLHREYFMLSGRLSKTLIHPNQNISSFAVIPCSRCCWNGTQKK